MHPAPFVITVPALNNQLIVSPNYGEEPQGPTGYPSEHRRLQVLLGIYIFLQTILKFAQIPISAGINGPNFGNPYIPAYMPILFIGFFIAMINQWLVVMAFSYKQNMTLKRFSMDRLRRSPFIYLMLLDNLMLVGIPLLGLLWGLNTGISLGFCIFMTVCNNLWFLAVSQLELNDHMPLLLNDNYLFAGEQQTGDSQNYLRIVESGCFKIVIYNTSKERYTGELTIVRRTLEPSYYHRRGARGPRYNETTCQFSVYMDSSYGIPPQGFITLVPETHTLPGAVQIQDFRAFGYNRRTIVETMIFSGTRQLVKLTQNYRPLVPGLNGRRFLPTAVRDRQHVNSTNVCPVSE